MTRRSAPHADMKHQLRFEGRDRIEFRFRPDGMLDLSFSRHAVEEKWGNHWQESLTVFGVPWQAAFWAWHNHTLQHFRANVTASDEDLGR